MVAAWHEIPLFTHACCTAISCAAEHSAAHMMQLFICMIGMAAVPEAQLWVGL